MCLLEEKYFRASVISFGHFYAPELILGASTAFYEIEGDRLRSEIGWCQHSMFFKLRVV
jgi:hypothetical protein